MSAVKQKVRAGWGWRRWLIVGGLAVSVFAGVWWWGSEAWSQPGAPAAPAGASAPVPAPTPPGPAVSPEYAHRVVAYIHGSVPVTREMLGNYLIERYGPEKLELMVNKLIIDEACKARKIEVTPGEVNAQLDDDLKGVSLDRKQFVEQYLKHRHLNLTEWMEDVIKPKLQLSRLASGRVTYTEADVKMAYDAYYGERIEAQLILWPMEEQKQALTEYAIIRDDPQAFDHKARYQASSQLAARGGLVQPIGRNASGCSEAFEKDLFSLQPGEMTQLHQEPQGYVVAKCVKRISPDTTKSLEAVRSALVKEVIRKKTELEVPKVFAELRQAADPQLLLKDPNRTEDLGSEVKKTIEEADRFLAPMTVPNASPGRPAATPMPR
jgi:hypothetical protein